MLSKAGLAGRFRLSFPASDWSLGISATFGNKFASGRGLAGLPCAIHRELSRMKTHLGHYEIVSELGRGGMGVVYKGYEPALTRYVAIKELSPALAGDAAVVERFLREARSMALLNDPHIIQIYSIGQENDLPFFVMEFVDGSSVAALIQRDKHLQPG